MMNPVSSILRKCRLAFLVFTLLALSALSAQDPTLDSPAATNRWLRSLLVEARSGLQHIESYQSPRLFTETISDGRTYFQLIQDNLGMNWVALDEAVTLLVEESRKMKALAEEADPEDQPRYVEARRLYLSKAAELLSVYRDSVAAVHEHALGDFLPEALTDLALPGEINIKEIAGGGTLNFLTGGFSGRISGMVDLPGLESSLSVPNLSFDSRGNVDFQAHGRTRVHVGEGESGEGFTITVPERRPIALRVEEDGEWSAAGGLRLQLPDGNQVEGYFDVDDPVYEFGLRFAGTLLLQLAKDFSAIRPTFAVDTGADEAFRVLEGFAAMFGSFGRGMESFLDEAPELPSTEDIEVGRPPDFKAPEMVVPLDVLDAMLVSFSNEQIRPLLNGALEERNAALKQLRSTLKGMQRDLASQQSNQAPKLSQIKQLKRYHKINARMAQILEDEAAKSLLGDDEEQSSFTEDVLMAADAAVALAEQYLENTVSDPNASSGENFRHGFASMKLYLSAVTTQASLGGSGDINVAGLEAKLDEWQGALLDRYGLNLDGSVKDAARAAALSAEQYIVLAMASLELDSYRAVLTITPNQVHEELLQAAFDSWSAIYTKAVNEDDFINRAVSVQHLIQLLRFSTKGFLSLSEEEELQVVEQLNDTLEALVEQGGGEAAGKKFAADVFSAATANVDQSYRSIALRKRELLGQNLEDRQRLPFDPHTEDLEEDTFFEAIASLFTLDLGTATEDRLRQNMARYLGGVRVQSEENYDELDEISRNMEASLARLKFLADALAFVEVHLPDESTLFTEMQATWQPLHVQWWGVAEARKYHWMLCSYLAELGDLGSRYGNGLSSSLKQALLLAGQELGTSLESVLSGMEGLVGAVDTERFSFQLPGDVEIQRLSGSVLFNRQTLAWEMNFGGLLEFPDIQAIFEVPSAQLFSTGLFAVNLKAESESSFGLNDDFALSMEALLEGRLPFVERFENGNPVFYPPNLGAFTATGTLLEKATGETLGANIDYSSDLNNDGAGPDGHRFTVLGTYQNITEIGSPEIVMFQGGVGFTLETDLNGVPGQAAAEVNNITIGLLQRAEAAGTETAELESSDYYLLFSNGTAKTSYFVVTDETDPDVGDQVVEMLLGAGGTLTLPADIFQGPGDVPASITLQSDICVRWNLDTPTSVRWCDVDGNPVRIAFENIGFRIPGLEEAETTKVESDAELIPEEERPPGFEAGVSAILLLSGGDFPVIEKINADLLFPVPGQNGSNPDPNLVELVVEGENWRIDGFPDKASIALGSDVKLLDLDGLEITIPKQSEVDSFPNVPAGLSFVRDPDTLETSIRIASSMAVSIDSSLIQSEEAEDQDETPMTEGKLETAVSGLFTWQVGSLPSFDLADITFRGRFRLGGEEGIELKGAGSEANAMVSIQNPAQMFDRSPENPNPFQISLSGALKFADLAELGLQESTFIWDDRMVNAQGNLVPRDPSNNLLPRFTTEGICAGLGADAIELANDLLPIYPTNLCLSFQNPSLPIFPAEGVLGLFDPENLIVTGSGKLSLPTGTAIESGSPGVSGSVDDLVITFNRDASTGFPIPDFGAIDGFSLSLNNLDIPPLGGITGKIGIQNINDPPNLYFIGEVGGEVKGMGASILLAMSLDELIGACFELNAGPAGIPIDGGTLGGILLTGGSGGINFKNQFADPCAFEAYLMNGDLSATRPGNPQDFTDPDSGHSFPPSPAQEEVLPPLANCVTPTQPQFTCLQGEFPPVSMNPLSETIQVQGQPRLIFKGSNLPAQRPNPNAAPSFNFNPLSDAPHNFGVDDALALAGITAAELNAMTPQEAIAQFVQGLTTQVESSLTEFIALLPGEDDDRSKQFYSQTLREFSNSLDESATAFLSELFRNALEADPTTPLYDLLVEKAAEGIPCFDVTLKLNGTFSHSTISTVLSGKGGVTVSTTGTAVLEGSINLVGIPVGTGTLAFALTDSSGTINPSFGGIIEAGVGPLELGAMTMSLSCLATDGGSCYTVVQEELQLWVTTNITEFVNLGVAPFMVQMMDVAAPRRSPDGVLLPRDPAEGVETHFLAMNEEERFAWYSSFLNIFQIVVDNTLKVAEGKDPTPLPVDLGQNADTLLASFLSAYRSLVVNILTQVNPRICMSGDVAPSLFGFPLTGGSKPLAGGFLYERVVDTETNQDYQQLISQLEFSPSMLLLSSFGGSFAVPSVDQASMAYSLRVPAFTEEDVSLLMTDPGAFAASQMTALVEDSVMTYGYQLEPLGYTLADGQGRVIFPRLGAHPLNTDRFLTNLADPENPIPLPAWVSVDERAAKDTAYPTRREVILAAVSKGQLQNPIWKGTGTDLAALFALPGSDCYVPGNPACLQFTQQVGERIAATDPDFKKVGSLDFAVDYFPHGGFIGGAEIALPNVLAQPPPLERLSALATVPASLAEFNKTWLPNAALLFGDPSNEKDPNFGKPGFAYFTGTTCAGQMAMYVPAPNPPLSVFDGNEAQALFDAISEVDFDRIASGTAGQYPEGHPAYPADQLMLSGWMDVPILGLPVAQGLVDYDADAQCFSLETRVLGDYTRVISGGDTAFVEGQLVETLEFDGVNSKLLPSQTPAVGIRETYTEVSDPGDTWFTAGQVVFTATFDRVNQEMEDQALMKAAGVQLASSWLNDLVGASLQVQIKAPEYLEGQGFDPDQPIVGGSNERLALLGAKLPNSPEKVEAYLQQLYSVMPRASVLADASFTIPPEFSDLMRFSSDVDASAEVSLMAFSPYFDPDFGLGAGGEVLDNSSLARLRRQGGIGLRGNFEFGLFPNDLAENQHLIFEASTEATLALTPQNDPSLFPDILAEVQVAATLPNKFTFDESIPQPFHFEGLLRLDTAAEVGESSLLVEGALSPLDFGPFLAVRPLPEHANAQDLLGGRVVVNKTAGDPERYVELDPASVQVPLLGNITGRIYGEKSPVVAEPDPWNPDHYSYSPFRFAPYEGQSWQASLELQGTLQIRSPFDVNGAVLFEAAPLTSDGEIIPFLCSIDAVGTEEFDLKLQVPTGITLTFFPGTVQQSRMSLAGNAAACLLITHEGRIYFDSGTQVLELALPNLASTTNTPFAEIMGRIELGFEPVDASPSLQVLPLTASFSVEPGQSQVERFTITNTNNTGSLLEVGATLSDGTDFEITPSRLLIPGGDSAELEVRYTPKSFSDRNVNLILTHNAAPDPLQIPLLGEVERQAEFHSSTNSMNFGAVALGSQRRQAFLITNTGSQSLYVSGFSADESEFDVIGGGRFIQPSQSREVIVTFTPESSGLVTATLSMTSSDPSVPTATISLVGNGSNRYWYEQRKGRGEVTLRDLAFGAEDGFAAGDFGALYEAAVDGRAWERDGVESRFDFRTALRVSDQVFYLAGVERSSATSQRGLAYKSTNGGSSWTEITLGRADNPLRFWNDAAVVPGEGRVFLVGGYEQLARIVEDENGEFKDKTITPSNSLPPLHGIAFSPDAKTGLAVGEQGLVLKTTDGGSSWVPLTNLPVEVGGRTLFDVAANPVQSGTPATATYPQNFVVVGEGGLILRTNDQGATWSVRNSNSSEDLHAVVRNGASQYYAVGKNGTILRGSTTGVNWSVETTEIQEDLLGVTVSWEGTGNAGSEVWAVGVDGGIYHRVLSPISGPIPVITMEEPFNQAENRGVGELVIREVRIANPGTEALVMGITASGTDAGDFVILEDRFLDTDTKNPGSDIEVPPGCEGIFHVITNPMGTGQIGSTLNFSGNESSLDKHKVQVITNVRSSDFTALGHVEAPACVRLPPVFVGEASTAAVALRNIGQEALLLLGAEVRHNDPSSTWDVRFPLGLGELKKDGTTSAVVTLTASEPGLYRSILELPSTAGNGVVRVEVLGEVLARPESILFTSDLVGSTLFIDANGNGTLESYTTPVVFQVVDGVPGSMQMQRGRNIQVQAPLFEEQAGVAYEFMRWEPGSEAAFSFTVGESVSSFHARYASGRIAAPETTNPPIRTGVACDFGQAQQAVPYGGWLRISEASLTLPWLGEGGEAFAVSGNMMLSRQKLQGSLTSSAIQVLGGENSVFSGKELLEIRPGSWDIDIDAASGEARLRSQSPGIQVLDTPALPPSTLDLMVDLQEGNSKRKACFYLGIQEEIPLLPGVLALGPGAAQPAFRFCDRAYPLAEGSLGVFMEVTMASSKPSFRFLTTGSIRALADPRTEADWLLEEPYQLEIESNGTLSPYTFSSSETLVDLKLFQIDSIAGSSRLGPSYDGNEFSLLAENFEVTLLDSAEAITVQSIEAGLLGELNLSLSLPLSGMNAGPVSFVPSNASDRDALLSMNALSALFELDLPALFVNSRNALWPDDLVELDPPAIRSTEFAIRGRLPAVDFSADGTSGVDFQLTGGSDADNYFELRRDTNGLAARLRSEQDFLIGEMRVRLEATQNALDGTLSGRVGIDVNDPTSPLNFLNLFQDSISMRLRSNPPNGRSVFELNRYILGFPVRLDLGEFAPLGRACLLKDGTEALEDRGSLICFP